MINHGKATKIKYSGRQQKYAQPLVGYKIMNHSYLCFSSLLHFDVKRDKLNYFLQ